MPRKKTETKTPALEAKMLEKEATELVLRRFRVSETYTTAYFTRFQQYYELYRSHLQSGRLPWRSNLFIPKTFEIIETVAPRIAQAQRTFVALPVEGRDVKEAEAFTDLLKFQFERTDMERIIGELTKETLIYGTGIVKVSWRDGKPYPEVVDIFDFFPDPKARNDQELKYVIHRLERDIEDLEANPNYDKNALKKLKEGTGQPKDNQERQQRLGVIGVTAEDGTRKRYEVLEYHGLFQGKPYIIVVADGVLLRADPSPYKKIPFVVVNDHEVPHELYGIGEIEPIESLQNELNDVRNQRMDNIKLNINSMWKVVAGGVQFEDELVSRPGGIVHVTRPDGLIPNDRQVVPSEAFTEESVIKSDMERATGANSPLSGALVSPMGGTQGGVLNRTATAYQGAINQADKRFNAKVQQIKRGVIRIGRMFLEYDQLFMQKPQIIRVVGEDVGQYVMEVRPEDIQGEFDFTIDVEYLDEFQQMQQNISLLQVLQPLGGFDAAKFAAENVLPKSGVKNYKEYLVPPQPPAPEQPKITYQFRGDVAPDAVAQIVEKTEGVRTNPEVVASQMRAQQQTEKLNQAEMLAKISQSAPETPQGGQE